jgi:hypothetical protein
MPQATTPASFSMDIEVFDATAFANAARVRASSARSLAPTRWTGWPFIVPSWHIACAMTTRGLLWPDRDAEEGVGA